MASNTSEKWWNHAVIGKEDATDLSEPIDIARTLYEIIEYVGHNLQSNTDMVLRFYSTNNDL